ncbi:hypothetical protein GCM10014715_66100 [Streptomyces spiralis]|uniref:Regulatory protein n=1 Tax=Streptomyces spiralis TaxID=66376 RepID=A0A919AED7_9ACTN|nr:hypothetical protein [Streptomyces spiralis]GHF00701.1 hypothetical protein GCM10014715_66100 [Streptomyces spiralis]
MSKTETPATGLSTQYASQVATDLENNLKEQERVSGELAALQEQLATLQQEHAVLVSIQQALGVTSASQTSAARRTASAVPAPRKKATVGPVQGKRAQAKKSAATSQKSAAKKSVTKSAADKTTPAAQRTLVEIVREHLTAQKEPRSAAEITTALGQQHPERDIKSTVVRTTLEGLVAKNQAQRSKQGSSVFYTAPEVAKASAAGKNSQEQPA